MICPVFRQHVRSRDLCSRECGSELLDCAGQSRFHETKDDAQVRKAREMQQTKPIVTILVLDPAFDLSGLCLPCTTTREPQGQGAQGHERH